jgi:manganese efflux pump family protein
VFRLISRAAGDVIPMSIATLSTWMATIFAGLILLVIWLMEYDRDFQTSAATRLPVPVISTHALLGVGGLLVWGFYLVTDEDPLAWASVAALSVVALLGLVMAARWVGVYRAYATPSSSSARLIAVPPERHFPRPVIVVHGLLAVATIALVVYTVFYSGS